MSSRCVVPRYVEGINAKRGIGCDYANYIKAFTAGKSVAIIQTVPSYVPPLSQQEL